LENISKPVLGKIFVSKKKSLALNQTIFAIRKGTNGKISLA